MIIGVFNSILLLLLLYCIWFSWCLILAHISFVSLVVGLTDLAFKFENGIPELFSCFIYSSLIKQFYASWLWVLFFAWHVWELLTTEVFYMHLKLISVGLFSHFKPSDLKFCGFWCCKASYNDLLSLLCFFSSVDRMILKYLIPVKLSIGILPKDWLLEKYNLVEVRPA